MNDQREMALMEHRIRVMDQAKRLFWIPVDYLDYVFHVGIQIFDTRDVEIITKLELSKVVDLYIKDELQSNLVDLIIISNTLYKHVANYCDHHDIHIDIMNYNQPVLSTIYLNNPPSKEN